MATKKNSKPQKKRGKKKNFEEPPVVVGGGNSVDITFLDTASNPGDPPGKKKFRLPNNIKTVVIFDGTDPVPKLVPVSKKFTVSFF